jgi:hypothetical protein
MKVIIYTYHQKALVYNFISVLKYFNYTVKRSLYFKDRYIKDPNQWIIASLNPKKKCPETWLYEHGLNLFVTNIGFNYQDFLDTATFKFIENQIHSEEFKKRIIFRYLRSNIYSSACSVANYVNAHHSATVFNSYQINILLTKMIDEGYPIGYKMDKRGNRSFIKKLQ